MSEASPELEVARDLLNRHLAEVDAAKTRLNEQAKALSPQDAAQLKADFALALALRLAGMYVAKEGTMTTVALSMVETLQGLGPVMQHMKPKGSRH